MFLKNQSNSEQLLLTPLHAKSRYAITIDKETGQELLVAESLHKRNAFPDRNKKHAPRLLFHKPYQTMIALAMSL